MSYFRCVCYMWDSSISHIKIIILHLQRCFNVCVLIYVCVHMCMHMCAYTCIHIHTVLYGKEMREHSWFIFRNYCIFITFLTCGNIMCLYILVFVLNKGCGLILVSLPTQFPTVRCPIFMSCPAHLSYELQYDMQNSSDARP